MVATSDQVEATDAGQATEWTSAALASVALSLFAILVLVAYSGILVIGSSALSLPGENLYREQVATFFPQGWAFFTRSPRTAELLAYELELDGELHSLVLGPNAQRRWSFGLNRTPRTQEFEYSIIAQELSDDSWHSCEGPATVSCVREMQSRGAETVSVSNDLPAATICGEIVLVRHTAFAWVYANEGFDPELAVDEVAMADVGCDG